MKCDVDGSQDEHDVTLSLQIVCRRERETKKAVLNVVVYQVLTMR